MRRTIAALTTIIITIMSLGIKAEAAELPNDGVLIVTTAASDDGAQLDRRIDQYSALPECIRGAFAANGVTITLVSPSEASDSNKYMGWTYHQNWTWQDGAYVRTSAAWSKIYLVSREKSDASTLLHESGHLVDNIYGGGWPQTGENWGISTSAEWLDLYSRYKNTISSLASTGPKNVYDASEAWAETFMNVCLDPEKVKTKAPELYDYTVGIIQSFGEYGDTSLPRETAEKPIIVAEVESEIPEEVPEIIEPVVEEIPEITEPIIEEIPEAIEPIVQEIETEPETEIISEPEEEIIVAQETEYTVAATPETHMRQEVHHEEKQEPIAGSIVFFTAAVLAAIMIRQKKG